MASHPDIPLAKIVLAKLKLIKPHLKTQWGITELALFGSVSRNEATAQSDIDLMIDYGTLSVPAFLACCDYLEEQLERPMDVLTRAAIRPATWQFIKDEMRYV